MGFEAGQSKRTGLSLNLGAHPNAIAVGVLMYIPVVWPKKKTSTYCHRANVSFTNECVNEHCIVSFGDHRSFKEE